MCVWVGFAAALVAAVVVGCCVVGAAGAVVVPLPPSLPVPVPALGVREDRDDREDGAVDRAVPLALGDC